MKMLDRASHQQEHLLRQEQEQASEQGSPHGPGRRPLHSRRSSRRREGDEIHKKEESMKAEEERRASLLHAIRSSNRMKAATLRNSVDAAGRQLPKDPDVMARVRFLVVSRDVRSTNCTRPTSDLRLTSLCSSAHTCDAGR